MPQPETTSADDTLCPREIAATLALLVEARTGCRAEQRRGGLPVEDMELRAGEHIRWTRNDTGLGLVKRQTAVVAAVREGQVTFRLEDGRRIDLSTGDPELRHVDRAWASPVHACQGRTVDSVIASMEADHLHLTTQTKLHVEISRACVELFTDDKAGKEEQLEAVAGERIAALEVVGPESGEGWEAGVDAGQESHMPASQERDRVLEPAMEPTRPPKGLDCDLRA